jgi:hypothetical protein
MPQVIEHLPSKHEALSSNPNIANNNDNSKKKERKTERKRKKRRQSEK